MANNFATGLGGGFGDEDNQGTLTCLVHSTFANNGAGVFGGGIYEGGPATSIADSTITGNAAQAVGGGIFIAPAKFGGTNVAPAETTPNTFTLSNPSSPRTSPARRTSWARARRRRRVDVVAVPVADNDRHRRLHRQRGHHGRDRHADRHHQR